MKIESSDQMQQFVFGLGRRTDRLFLLLWQSGRTLRSFPIDRLAIRLDGRNRNNIDIKY